MRVASAVERVQFVREQAFVAGLDLCGIVSLDAAAQNFPELTRYDDWLAHGYAGEMKYLHDERRADPRRVLEGAQSLIVVALNYNSRPTDHAGSAKSHTGDLSDSAKSPRGKISRYAWGDDYHEVILEKLNALIAALRAEFPEPFEARAYVDTGPIVERVAAKYAGLGWLGKNTCLINSKAGSWLFLGVIVTTLAIEPSLAPGEPPAPDLCGTCTRCLDACPTQAFPEPYVLDARRCISYLTIELRGEIPEEFRAAMGNHVIGCDICQDVCPWNRKAPVTALAAFQPREFPAPADAASPEPVSLASPELEWLAGLTQEEFSAAFRKSAVKRAKWRGLVRNACIALGNSRLSPDDPAYARILSTLRRLASSSDEAIAGAAAWALTHICSAQHV
jgi:epoxyqueuosine reductase